MQDHQCADIDHVWRGRRCAPDELIEVLQDVQGSCGYLPEDALREVSEKLEVPLIEVFRVASFYKAFSLSPPVKHQITICDGTACHVRGSERFVDILRSLLDAEPGEATPDLLFKYETVNCLGCCALAPIVVLDDDYHRRTTPARLRGRVKRIQEREKEEVQ